MNLYHKYLLGTALFILVGLLGTVFTVNNKKLLSRRLSGIGETW